VVHSLTLCHHAEQALVDIVQAVFANFRDIVMRQTTSPTSSAGTNGSKSAAAASSSSGSIAADATAAVTAAADSLPEPLLPPMPPPPPPVSSSSSSSSASSSSSSSSTRVGAGCYGLPCAVKIFGFLCSQLQQGPVLSAYVAAFHRGGEPIAGMGGGASKREKEQMAAALKEKDSSRLLCLRLVKGAWPNE
jgi:hypothetical protein